MLISGMGHFFLLLGCKGIIPTYCCGLLVISKLKLCMDRNIKYSDIVIMEFGEIYFWFFSLCPKKFLLEVMRIVIMFFNFLIIFFNFLIRNSLLIKLYVCDCSESNF